VAKEEKEALFVVKLNSKFY